MLPTTNHDADDKVASEYIFFNVLEDGTISMKFRDSKKIPPCDDPFSGVKIKDVEISPDVSARVFLPEDASTEATSKKLPLVLYMHGGGFCIESAFSEVYTGYVTKLVAEAKVIVVSVEYGLFPKRPLPAPYEDCWAALKWVAAHAKGCGPDPWINDYADLRRIFVGGDSAGGNTSHTLLARVGHMGLGEGVRIEGMIMAHPFFGIGGKDDEMWMYMCRENEGPNDPRMRPSVEDLSRLGCERVLVFVAEYDRLKSAGKGYVESLIKSGWKGTVEIEENRGKKHCFHIYNRDDKEAIAMLKRISSFIHNDDKERSATTQNGHLNSSLTLCLDNKIDGREGGNNNEEGEGKEKKREIDVALVALQTSSILEGFNIS